MEDVKAIEDILMQYELRNGLKLTGRRPIYFSVNHKKFQKTFLGVLEIK